MKGAILFSAVSTVYIFATEEHQAPTPKEFYSAKAKPFPWSCPNCGLFEQECWDECKGKSTGKKAH